MHGGMDGVARVCRDCDCAFSPMHQSTHVQVYIYIHTHKISVSSGKYILNAGSVIHMRARPFKTHLFTRELRPP
jgi:predicted phosphodiesterase